MFDGPIGRILRGDKYRRQMGNPETIGYSTATAWEYHITWGTSRYCDQLGANEGNTPANAHDESLSARHVASLAT